MPNVVTPEELKDWLKYKEWKLVSENDEGTIVATYRDVVELMIKPEEILYDVNVEAVDDPSDSLEEITHDPLRTLVEFIGTGVGDEFLKKMSALRPSHVKSELLRIASEISNGRVNEIVASKRLRRLSLSVSLSGVNIRVANKPSEFEKTSIKILKKNMEEKGWNVKSDDPEKIDLKIGDQFEGTIIVDVVMWDYDIKVIGNGKLKQAERSDNPLKDITSFMRKDEVDEILVDKRMEMDEKKNKDKNNPTVAPGDKKKNKKNPFEGKIDPDNDPFA